MSLDAEGVEDDGLPLDAATAQSTSVVNAKPDNLADTYWDPDKGAKWDEIGQRLTEYESRMQAAVKDPADLDFTVKLEDGTEIELDAQNELFQSAAATFAKHGGTKEMWSELTMAFAKANAALEEQARADRDAEVRKLGDRAKDRIMGAKTSLVQSVGEDGAAALMKAIRTADAFAALEQLLESAKAPNVGTGQGAQDELARGYEGLKQLFAKQA